MSINLSIDKKVTYLKNSLVFANVEDEALKHIAVEMEEIEVNQDQILFQKGDSADKMYVIIEGVFKIHDGENVLNVLKDPCIFGEYALIDGKIRTASVTSLERGRLLTLSAQSFHTMLKNNLSFTLSIMKSLVFRITSEKDKSEKLLQNILPYEIAEELKLRGRVNVRNIDFATVLFTDFSGFTRISESISSDELIEELNFCFTHFDNIISKYGVEKIKTIGDAYMCVGGIPIENKSNPFDVALAALEIRAFMNQRYKEKTLQGKDYWQCRVGINTGNVIAGIIGAKKFAYDIWSDTVNTASRMESCSEPGNINISASTYDVIKDYFNCSYRGEIEAKGKGKIKMYFLDSIKEGFATNADKTIPNNQLMSIIKNLNK